MNVARGEDLGLETPAMAATLQVDELVVWTITHIQWYSQ